MYAQTVWIVKAMSGSPRLRILIIRTNSVIRTGKNGRAIRISEALLYPGIVWNFDIIRRLYTNSVYTWLVMILRKEIGAHLYQHAPIDHCHAAGRWALI